MYADAHEDTDTQTVTVTKITTAPTGFTNTDKDCNLHLSGLDFGKKNVSCRCRKLLL